MPPLVRKAVEKLFALEAAGSDSPVRRYRDIQIIFSSRRRQRWIRVDQEMEPGTWVTVFEVLCVPFFVKTMHLADMGWLMRVLSMNLEIAESERINDAPEAKAASIKNGSFARLPRWSQTLIPFVAP
jgi:hypothetical protein